MLAIVFGCDLSAYVSGSCNIYKCNTIVCYLHSIISFMMGERSGCNDNSCNTKNIILELLHTNSKMVPQLLYVLLSVDCSHLTPDTPLFSTYEWHVRIFCFRWVVVGLTFHCLLSIYRGQYNTVMYTSRWLRMLHNTRYKACRIFPLCQLYNELDFLIWVVIVWQFMFRIIGFQRRRNNFYQLSWFYHRKSHGCWISINSQRGLLEAPELPVLRVTKISRKTNFRCRKKIYCWWNSFVKLTKADTQLKQLYI